LRRKKSKLEEFLIYNKNPPLNIEGDFLKYMLENSFSIALHHLSNNVVEKLEQTVRYQKKTCKIYNI
ncbi:hypothetical protein P4Z96_32315, partial [Bacillus thuringiensis]|nr:hypothetical protein [Bacillus thuringiensis]